MITLLDYTNRRLATELYDKFTLSPPSTADPTCVLKWLATTEELQLDELRDACIDALGTYLLPVFHKHADHYGALLMSLPATTLLCVIIATARCSSCVCRASDKWPEVGPRAPCPTACTGRHTNSYGTRLELLTVQGRNAVSAQPAASGPSALLRQPPVRRSCAGTAAGFVPGHELECSACFCSVFVSAACLTALLGSCWNRRTVGACASEVGASYWGINGFQRLSKMSCT